MTDQLDDAIRIARRAAEHGTTGPGDKAVTAVFRALASMPDPDAEGSPIKGGWFWESDGTGKPAYRRDQHIVIDSQMGRIATFEDPGAAKNARAASCTPLMIAALKRAESVLKLGAKAAATLPVKDELYAPVLAEVRRVLKETRYRKSQ